MKRYGWVILLASLFAVPLVAATVDFKSSGVVTVDAARELKPAGPPVERKSWAYIYAAQSGTYRILVELPDKSVVVAQTATVALEKGKTCFLAIRTQVTLKDAAETPQKPEVEATK